MSEAEGEAIVLPIVPEPVLTPAERAAVSELYRDPAFWEWFVSQPEPGTNWRHPRRWLRSWFLFRRLARPS